MNYQKLFMFALIMIVLTSGVIAQHTQKTEQQANAKVTKESQHIYTPTLFVFDSKTHSGGKGWVGKGEEAATIGLDEADSQGKRPIHYHNKLHRYLYSVFGWQWDAPQAKPIDIRQYDAVSFEIKVTGPQKPQQLFFAITELNPAPVPLNEYNPEFANGAWHRITIPVQDMKWRGLTANKDLSDLRGFVFMTFVWDAAEFDVELDHFSFDRDPSHSTPAVILPVSEDIPFTSPQLIPGKIECAFYDKGGEGLAYHDTDPVNILSGVLNRQKAHQRSHASSYYWDFRKDEGVDISYTKDGADFSHPNKFNPPVNQLYIGGASDGEWCNYTVNVQKAGTYKIIALYANGKGTIRFSINNKPECECKFPIPTGGFHNWAREEIGTISFDQTGVQMLTLHYDTGNNLAYFEFVAVS